jgi:hypothetical protein
MNISDCGTPWPTRHHDVLLLLELRRPNVVHEPEAML